MKTRCCRFCRREVDGAGGYREDGQYIRHSFTDCRTHHTETALAAYRDLYQSRRQEWEPKRPVLFRTIRYLSERGYSDGRIADLMGYERSHICKLRLAALAEEEK